MYRIVVQWVDPQGDATVLTNELWTPELRFARLSARVFRGTLPHVQSARVWEPAAPSAMNEVVIL